MHPLALSLGEPAGIGPDITIKAWLRRAELGLSPFYLIGDRRYLSQRAEALGAHIKVAAATPEDAASIFADALPVVDVGVAVTAAPGKPDNSSAPAAIAAIQRAVADVFAGKASGIVTNPVAKNVLYRAGFAEPGHTEYLAKLAAEFTGKAAHPVMMLSLIHI